MIIAAGLAASSGARSRAGRIQCWQDRQGAAQPAGRQSGRSDVQSRGIVRKGGQDDSPVAHQEARRHVSGNPQHGMMMARDQASRRHQPVAVRDRPAGNDQVALEHRAGTVASIPFFPVIAARLRSWLPSTSIRRTPRSPNQSASRASSAAVPRTAWEIQPDRRRRPRDRSALDPAIVRAFPVSRPENEPARNHPPLPGPTRSQGERQQSRRSARQDELHHLRA